MITKAIVEEVLDNFSIRVRIPIINAISGAKQATSKNDLSIAPICTISNVSHTVEVGDIVFVGFEDNDLSKPIILGQLYKRKNTDNIYEGTLTDMIIRTLNVQQDVVLPESTKIGGVSSIDIQCLKNMSGNIQYQLDELQKNIDSLESRINEKINSLDYIDNMKYETNNVIKDFSVSILGCDADEDGRFFSENNSEFAPYSAFSGNANYNGGVTKVSLHNDLFNATDDRTSYNPKTYGNHIITPNDPSEWGLSFIPEDNIYVNSIYIYGDILWKGPGVPDRYILTCYDEDSKKIFESIMDNYSKTKPFSAYINSIISKIELKVVNTNDNSNNMYSSGCLPIYHIDIIDSIDGGKYVFSSSQGNKYTIPNMSVGEGLKINKTTIEIDTDIVVTK